MSVISRAATEIPIKEMFGIITGAVAPRPIAMVSTIAKDGQVNLSPFSFFNAFGANPPTLVFSPSRRVRDNTVKHTLENVLEVPEAVIHICNSEQVEQLSLSSAEYAREENEFIKAGFKSSPSISVTPPRMAEAPVSFECKVKDVISLGEDRGAGNLVICEVQYIHINDAILDSNGMIDPFLLDPVSRLGKAWYGKVTKDSLFEIQKPLGIPGIGIDQLPAALKHSHILSGNDLAKLASVPSLPSSIIDIKENMEGQELQLKIKTLLAQNEIEAAWKLLT